MKSAGLAEAHTRSRSGGELHFLPPVAAADGAFVRRRRRLRAASPDGHLVGIGNSNGSLSSSGEHCSASSDGIALATASAAAAAGHRLVESATTDVSCGSRVLEEMASESPSRAAKPSHHANVSPSALATRLKRRFSSALGSISSDGSTKQDSVDHVSSSLNQLSSSSMGTETSAGGTTSDRVSVASSRLFKRTQSSHSPRPSSTPSSSPESGSTGALSHSSRSASQSSSLSMLSTLLKRKGPRHSSTGGGNGDGDGGRTRSRSSSHSRRSGGGRSRPSLAITVKDAKHAMRNESTTNEAIIIEDAITPVPVIRTEVAAAAAAEAAAVSAAEAAVVSATEASEAAARPTGDASGSSLGSKPLSQSASGVSGVSVSSEDEQPQYLEETDIGMTMVRIPDGEVPPPPGQVLPLSWQRLLFSLRGHVLTLHYMTPEDIVASADEPYLRDHEPLLESGQTGRGGAAAVGNGSQSTVSGSLVDDDNDYDDMSSDDPAAVGPRRAPTMEGLSAGPRPPSPARGMWSGHPPHRRSGGSGTDMSMRQQAASVVGSNISSEAAGSTKAGSGSCITVGADEVSFNVQEASGVSYANVSDVTMAVDVPTATFTLSRFPNLPPATYALPDTRHAARWKAATQVAGRHSIGDFYVMGKVLGAGAFGKVYEAEDRYSHELHAVKVVTLSGADARRDERVRREVAIVCELRHPGIVRTYRVIKLQRHVYFAMEVMRGGDLFDYCSSFPNLSEDRIVHIARGILQSVAFLHSVGVVHRYVTWRGGRCWVDCWEGGEVLPTASAPVRGVRVCILPLALSCGMSSL